jgi:hypothetical protein
LEVVGREPSEPRNINASEFPWQVGWLKVLATAETIRQGGRVEIHWKAGSMKQETTDLNRG